MSAINIRSLRECFFDDYLINTDKTTAEFRVHNPIRRETVMVFDEPWEGNGSMDQCIIRDNEKWMMYYIGRNMVNATSDENAAVYVNCCAISEDGLNWKRPELNLYEYKDSSANNIITARKKGSTDIMSGVISVFYDENPDCPRDERYKAIQVTYPTDKEGELWIVPSSDGIHFDSANAYLIERGGHYDSVKCCFWDKLCGKYRMYVRGYYIPDKYAHMFENDHDKASYTYFRKRDIRYLESTDAKVWSKSKVINFTNGVDEIELYENKIRPYYRAPHIYIGFPTRYNGRTYDGVRGWRPNYDELCGREERLKRYEMEDRFGLAVTDCAFMCSRDGINFYRHEDAFMRPGPENGRNWKYGDCYPAYALFETPSLIDGEENEISLLVPEDMWFENISLVRYSIRLDGFVSLHAGGKKEEVVVTKPFVYDGDNLYANISTSACGYIYFEIRSEDGETAKSYEIFGDSTDKKISFINPGKVSELKGKKVIMTLKMRDADIYSMRFGE